MQKKLSAYFGTAIFVVLLSATLLVPAVAATPSHPINSTKISVSPGSPDVGQKTTATVAIQFSTANEAKFNWTTPSGAKIQHTVTTRAPSCMSGFVCFTDSITPTITGTWNVKAIVFAPGHLGHEFARGSAGTSFNVDVT